ncbi:MAG: SAM-dependent methyltransferase, partial [Candidatus Cybelea sp.]
EVLPGPSAAMGVALLSGFPLQRFSFEGFPPRTSGERRARFSRAMKAGTTTIWYESPRRIRSALSDLAAVAPGAQIFVVREYTKHHEQHFLGTAEHVAAELPDPVMGEVAFAVAPYQVAAAVPTTEATGAAIDALLERGTRVKEVAKLLAARGFGERQQLYARAVERKARRKTLIKQG